MKVILAISVAAFISSAYSQTPESKFDSNLGGTNPELNEQEKKGVAVTEKWKDKSLDSLVSQPGVNSSVEFRFGESYPTIVCAVLQVTDIELQKGESVTSINMGDTTRWIVQSAVSRSGADQIQHLIVKPTDIGVSTSLIVTTDRRTYHLLLASDKSDFMHDVTFHYDTPVAELVPTPKRKDKDDSKDDSPRRRKTSVKKSDPIPVKDNSDENYIVNGSAVFKPVSVYSKDGKTYLEMPPEVAHDEAPVLFEERKSGLFGHAKNLCNYRVHGKWYVVDKVLTNATLVSGVGAGQKKVVIKHE